MGMSLNRSAIVIPAIALLLTMATAWAQEEGDIQGPKTFEEMRQEFVETNCKGPFAGNPIARDQRNAVLGKHKKWLFDFDTEEKQRSETAQKDPRRADLCGVDMSHTSLLGANLSGADLRFANLRGAWLLRQTNLGGAILFAANLSGAALPHANLSGADLTNVDLSMAILPDANLSGADLRGADLSGVLFEPKELPPIDSIAAAKSLELMYHKRRPEQLVKLRKAFDDAGYRDQARRITYAINRSKYHATPAAYPNASVLEILKKEIGWGTKCKQSDTRATAKQTAALDEKEENCPDVWKLVEDTFRYVFFDLPTQWGMNPGRALRILVVLISVFSLPYILALRYPGRGRIYRKWGAEMRPSTIQHGGRNKIRRSSEAGSDVEPLHYAWPKAILRGVQFSLASAFHIGYREFNVGNWISRLQSRDYSLYATGWVRRVAGIQSLISVYLLAMWALTYFGRPFD